MFSKAHHVVVVKIETYRKFGWNYNMSNIITIKSTQDRVSWLDWLVHQYLVSFMNRISHVFVNMWIIVYSLSKRICKKNWPPAWANINQWVPGWSALDAFLIIKILSRFTIVLNAKFAGEMPLNRCFKCLHWFKSSVICKLTIFFRFSSLECC